MLNTYSLDSKAKNFRTVKVGERILMKICDNQKSQITRLAVCEYDRPTDAFKDVFTNQFVFLSDSLEYILIDSTTSKNEASRTDNIPKEIENLDLDLSFLDKEKEK